jgi:hypothetical protein
MAAPPTSEPIRAPCPDPSALTADLVGVMAGPFRGGPSVPYGDGDPQDRVYVPAVSCAGCGEVNCLCPRGQIFLCRWCIEGTPSPTRSEALGSPEGACQPAKRVQTTRVTSRTRAA